ncbi:hypothetical protein [Frankia sp. CiP3]|uniref:hypothetical protein n=1 Tax=Frankia sp. CiP3 TaxID=2880971 RepID=UPI001EF4A633|nr:hypothetical protein [Frankia sp. CiP3]
MQRVLLPVLAGAEQPADLEYSDDLSFVRDLGMITEEGTEGPRIANPIYAEVISRALAEQVVPSPAALTSTCAGATQRAREPAPSSARCSR